MRLSSQRVHRPSKPPLYSLQKFTPATTLPLTLPEVKSALGIDADDNSEDDWLIIQLRAATEACERWTRRTFVNTTWTMFMDHFPGEPLPWWDGVRQIANSELTNLTMPLFMPRPPLGSVTHVKAHLDSGETTVPTADYFVDTSSEPGRIVLNTGKSWPTGVLRTANGVEVQYVAGYGPTGQDVPPPIRDAIQICIGDIRQASTGSTLKFEKVGDSSVSRFSPQETGSTMPLQAKNLLSTYRVWMV